MLRCAVLCNPVMCCSTLKDWYEKHKMWKFFSPTAPTGVQQQQGTTRRQVYRKRSKGSDEAATAAAAAAVAAGEEPPDDSDPTFAEFTGDFGPKEYVAAAAGQLLNLMPYMAPFKEKDWAAAVRAALAVGSHAYPGVKKLMAVSTRARPVELLGFADHRDTCTARIQFARLPHNTTMAVTRSCLFRLWAATHQLCACMSQVMSMLLTGLRVCILLQAVKAVGERVDPAWVLHREWGSTFGSSGSSSEEGSAAGQAPAGPRPADPEQLLTEQDEVGYTAATVVLLKVLMPIVQVAVNAATLCCSAAVQLEVFSKCKV